MRRLATGFFTLSLLPCLGPAQSAAPTPSASAARPLDAEEIRARERMIQIAVSTVVSAERTYAGTNGSFFDEIRCLTKPAECVPGLPADAAPFLDPTYDWLESKMGYVRKFHPGPRVPPEEIRKAGASPTSLRAFAFTATPVRPGETGSRAFCGDSSGRICFTPKGTEPPVKDGRCDPCQKLE
jgi:hypothetical protein